MRTLYIKNKTKMKKLTIISILILMTIMVFSQEPLRYETIEKLDSSYSKELIFNKMNEWIAINYVSANNVIQLSNKESGLIIVKAIIRYNGCGKWDKAYWGFIKYTLKINIKDYSYRIVVSDFIHEAWQSNKYGVSLGLLLDKPVNVKSMNAKWAQKNLIPDIIEKMTTHSINFFNDINKNILKNDTEW